jgi:hypothetical protein
MPISTTLLDFSNNLGFDSSVLPGLTAKASASPLLYPTVVKSRDPKVLYEAGNLFYVEFIVNDIGTGFRTGPPTYFDEPGLGISMLGADFHDLAFNAILGALLYFEGTVSVNGTYYSSKVTSNTDAPTTSGPILHIIETSGVYIGDAVSGANIVLGTKVLSINPGVSITLSQNVAGTISSGEVITFASLGFASEDVVSAAIDLVHGAIWFRVNGNNWNGNPTADPGSNIGGFSLEPLSDNVVLAITNNSNNANYNVTLNPGNYSSGEINYGFAYTIPSGFTPGWPDNEFSNSDLGVTKITSNAIYMPPNLAARKITSDIIYAPPNLAVRKLTADAIFGPPGLSVRKITAYAILQPASPIPPIPPTPQDAPIPIFPNLPISFPIKLSIVMDTIVGTTKSLREVRVAQQQLPLWDIEIPFQELRDQTQNEVPYPPFTYPKVFQEYEELVQLWLMIYGRTNVFGFNCPWDNSRLNQQIAIGDGTTSTFTIVRTWGSEPIATDLPIGLIGEVLSVQVNEIVIPSAFYTTNRNKISFIDGSGIAHPPGEGDPINMTFTFYYLCRFTEDEQDFEEFSKNRWTVPSLKFRSVIWP